MMLIFDMMEQCCIVNKAMVDDPYGSFQQVLTDGATFDATIIKNTTTEAQIAQKQGIKELYTVVVRKGVPLEFNMLIKRLSDGQIFKITSNATDSDAPNASTVRIAKVTAERWDDGAEYG